MQGQTTGTGTDQILDTDRLTLMVGWSPTGPRPVALVDLGLGDPVP